QVQKLLIRIGEQYPQAILFPLYVVVRSNSKVRARAAREVLESIYDEHAELVRETEGVSRELIRTTMLVSEQWQEAMVAAHAYYYANQSDKRVLPMLKAMHETARHPETPYEHHFVQTYGQYIAAAEAALDECLAETDPERKWDLLDAIWAPYNRLSQRIVKELATLESVSFKNTAPALLKYRDLKLAIPGTYAPGEDPVTIQAIDPQVKIHTTKQRPRQMNMVGSDGKQYVFLIKGREDLRQDERVMQVFGLVNSLLARDKGTARRSLAIERFPAVPLSPNSGLIGFYPNCSSIDKLVRCYRQARSVPGDLEQRLSHQFTPNWDSLTLMQKVESFEYAQANTSGDDLQRIMWYRSPNSEEWLARRTNYTRSLAVMSMAGYILGLGDRHPNNVLIHERTGKVVHIDLGDCFESAAQRDRFPEKVPFRLTRMLIKAMGVTGIEGAFRRSAYHTIRVLRANRDSMMAVLEAFVFDPLMTWVSIREPDEDPDRAPDTQQRPRQQCDNLMAHSMAGGNSAAGSTWVRQVARIGGLGASTYVAPNRKWQDGNSKALAIVKRIHDKLVGCDFDRSVRLGENKQVEKLIQQATSVDNLVVLYSGWVPHW
ncbi:phosphatidylinositol kinase- protein kinase tor1, partial [Coemansia nantahalensis]